MDDDLLIQPEDILHLIGEVQHDLQICNYAVTAIARPEFGFPEQRELVCRPVRGYVNPLVQGYGTPQLASQLALEAGNLQAGNYVAYISTEDMQAEDLQDGTVLLWNNNTYEAQYLRGIQHRGVALLHEIILNQTQKQQLVGR